MRRAVSTIPSIDAAIIEVHELLHPNDQVDDDAAVAALGITLDLLLDKRIHLPQQRTGC
ncbi:MAG: hypothetical protein ACXV3V_04915 [Actinomycetes bacterium]